MKILHAIFSFCTGGAETMLVDIVNQQCRNVSVGLVIVNDKVNLELLQTIDKRVEIYCLNRKESNKISMLQFYFKMKKIIDNFQPDVIHCHDNKLFPFFIKWRKKTCLTVHALHLSTLFVKSFRRVFAISEVVQKDVKERINIDSTVIYNGIKTEQYHPRTEYVLEPSKEEFRIIQISRLMPVIKGQHIATGALRLLLERHPEINVKLFFVGDGDALQELKALAIEKKVDKNIEFCGQTDRTWIKNHLKDFHLLIQPSLYEGFGLTVIEGFAAGLPVIASNIDGPKEILSVLKAGLLAEAGNPADLADKIYTVYNSYVSGNISNTGFLIRDKKELDMFDIQSTVKQYMDNYPASVPPGGIEPPSKV